MACAAPVDLAAVQRYASTTAQAGTSFASLAADFKGSCLRSNEIENYVVDSGPERRSRVLLTVPSTAQLMADVSIEGIALAPGYTLGAAPAQSSSSAPASAAISVTVPTDNTCEGAAEVSAAWDGANTTVLNYVQALGNLAGVDAEPGPSPSPLAPQLEKAGVSPEGIAAGSNLLSSIAAFFYHNAASRDIRSFLAAVNPSMPGAMQSLEIVDAAYSIELADEFDATTRQYGVAARRDLRDYAAASGKAERSAIARDLLRKRSAVVSALDNINDRRQGSAAYGSAIAQILATHEQLYEASQRSATLSDYLNVIQTTGAPVLTNLDKLMKAVK